LISNACFPACSLSVSLLLPFPTAAFSAIMAKRKATAKELEARAESNGYKRGTRREKDSTRDNGKHNIGKILYFLSNFSRPVFLFLFVMAFLSPIETPIAARVSSPRAYIITQSNPIVARGAIIETRPSKNDVFPQTRKSFLSQTTRLGFLLRVLLNQSLSNLAAQLRIFRLFLALLSPMPTSSVNEPISARQTGRPRRASEPLFQPFIFPSE
jgi:hypothetical protein